MAALEERLEQGKSDEAQLSAKHAEEYMLGAASRGAAAAGAWQTIRATADGGVIVVVAPQRRSLFCWQQAPADFLASSC